MPSTLQVLAVTSSALGDASASNKLVNDTIAQLTARIDALKARIAAMSQEAEIPRQLQTMPGVGLIAALAVETFAPPMAQFRRGRDFAAWLGLVPRQHSSGGHGRCCRTPTAWDSHRESMRLDGRCEQAQAHPLPHRQLVRLQRCAPEARGTADLAGQGDGLARAA